MSIVVTGASGFIGRAVVRALRRTDAAVIALSRTGVEGGIRVQSYDEAPPGDVLVHLAESPDRAAVNRRGDSCVSAALALMFALKRKGYRRIVYVSSAVVYGDADGTPHDVHDALPPFDSYTRAKYGVERALLDHPSAFIARLSNVYGPGMSDSNVVSRILRQIPGDGPVTVADSTPVRDFIWIEDAAAALALAATGRPAGIFNVGTGVGTSVAQLACLALAKSGQPTRSVCSTHVAERVSRLVVNITGTTAALDWRPTVTVADGVGYLLEARHVRV